MDDKFYHYSSTSRLRDIVAEFRINSTEMFIPHRRFIPIGAAPADLPDKKNDPAIFGLLDPLDTKWCTATYHSDTPLLQTVLRDIRDTSVSLLEISVNSADDVYIADYSAHLSKNYHGHNGEDKTIIQQIKRAYWESLVPLSAYRSKQMDYPVPEVICFSSMPLNRIRIITMTDKDELIKTVRAKGGFAPLSVPAHQPRHTPASSLHLT